MNTSIREHNLKAAALWGSGGRAYDRISRSISSAIDHCVDRLNPTPGERMADVATGTGWASRAVARLGAKVVGIDIAGPLLDAARDIAREQNLTIEYRLADVEALPFSGGEFDGVISTFGVMFARSAAGCVGIGADLPKRWTPCDSGLGGAAKTSSPA